MFVTTTREIINKLEDYEKENGIGSVLAISEILNQNNPARYIFHVTNRPRTSSTDVNHDIIEINKIKEEDIFKAPNLDEELPIDYYLEDDGK